MSLRRILIPIILSLVIVTQFVPITDITSRPAAAATTCDWAQFIADVTVPDGTAFVAGTAFTKVWRLKNIGSCTWTTSYAAIFYSGYQMGAPDSVGLTSNVAPGQTIDITVNMIAPYAPGHYRSYWRLRNAAGVQFGLGSSHAATFWADINVTASTSVENAYDFSANYCSASWTSGASALPCPGAAGDAKGFVTKVDSLTLEDGSLSSNPGLLVAPQQIAGGYVQGTFPPVTVQAGDHFQSIINCAYGAQNCYVNFRLEYQVGSGPVQVFWNFFERYEGLYYRADLDLSPLAGQEVRFILYLSDVSGHGIPAGDRALWGWPRITRLGGGSAPTVPPVSTDTPQPGITQTPQPTSTPTATGQPLPTSVPSYCNQATFISDVTIPDGTQLAAGSTFTKTWRIQNNSVCTWTTSYGAVFYGGTQMGPETEVSLPYDVLPGAAVDISVNMVTPTAPGHYRSYWMLRNASGVVFGTGSHSAYTFFADIYSVAAPNTPSPTSTSIVSPPTATSTPIIESLTPTLTPIVDTPTSTSTPVVNPPTSTWTALPTDTPLSQPTIVPTETSHPQPTNVPAYCDQATFISDVTIPDGTQLPAGSSFVKTWRIKNNSVCTWTTDYGAIYYGGTQMGPETEVDFAYEVPPGATVDITVDMIAPAAPGHYRSYWMLRDASGVVFGTGSHSIYNFFVDIYSVANSTPSPTSTLVVNPPSPTATNTPLPATCNLIYNGSFEQQMLALINAERANVGLSPLTPNYALETAAGWHSDDMALGSFISHTGSDGSSYWERDLRAGYTGRWGGEIIYAGSGANNSPERAVAWWMNDPPHKAVILADYQDFGAGYVYCPTGGNGGYFTVDFGHR